MPLQFPTSSRPWCPYTCIHMQTNIRIYIYTHMSEYGVYIYAHVFPVCAALPPEEKDYVTRRDQIAQLGKKGDRDDEDDDDDDQDDDSDDESGSKAKKKTGKKSKKKVKKSKTSKKTSQSSTGKAHKGKAGSNNENAKCKDGIDATNGGTTNDNDASAQTAAKNRNKGDGANTDAKGKRKTSESSASKNAVAKEKPTKGSGASKGAVAKQKAAKTKVKSSAGSENGKMKQHAEEPEEEPDGGSLERPAEAHVPPNDLDHEVVLPRVKKWPEMKGAQLIDIVNEIRENYKDKKWHKICPNLSIDKEVYTVAVLEPYFQNKVPSVGIRERYKTLGVAKALGTVRSHNLYLAKALAMGVAEGLAT